MIIGIHIYPAVTFPNMNDFSAEYLKDLIITHTLQERRLFVLHYRKVVASKNLLESQ